MAGELAARRVHRRLGHRGDFVEEAGIVGVVGAACLGGTHRFDLVAVLASGVVVAVLGGDAVLGLAQQVVVGRIVLVAGVAAPAGRTAGTGDIGHQRHAELHGGTVCTRLAAAVGDGPSAIGVVQNIDALGIAGVGRQIRTAFTIVAEGRITNTAFVGDASQGMREAAVLVVIELACVVRIVDVFQITGGVVAVAPAAARVIGDAGDAVIGVVTKDQILTCVGVDAFQPTLDVVAQGLGAAM